MKRALKGGVGTSLRRNYAALASKRYGNGNTADSPKIIAVVGAHGKTTTAQYLRELLAENGQTAVILESGNHDSVGVRRAQAFIRQARKDDVAYVIVVLGAHDIRHHVLGSMPLEVVIVTDTDQDNLDSIKLLLESQPKSVVLNRDDEQYDQLVEKEADAQTISFGKHEEADARIGRTKLYRRGSELQLVIDHQTKLNLATYLVGEANLYNLAAAVTALYVIGEPINRVDEGAARLESVAANYEYIDSPVPYSIVLDEARDKRALDLVVSAAKELAQRRLIVVTQLDTISENDVNELADMVDRLVVIDINDYMPNRGAIERVVSPDAAVKLGLRTARQGDTLLFAGPVFARAGEGGFSYLHHIIQSHTKE